MNRIERVLKGIKAHIKKQCERCSYDGDGCVNQLLRDAGAIIEEVSKMGIEIPETPVCSYTQREFLRAIRNAMREYVHATGHVPERIRMTRSAYEIIADSDAVTAYSNIRPSVYGITIEIEDTPQQNGCFGFTEGDVDE